MVYKALAWTEVFWISYIKWYKVCNNNLSGISVNKVNKGESWNSWIPNVRAERPRGQLNTEGGELHEIK